MQTIVSYPRFRAISPESDASRLMNSLRAFNVIEQGLCSHHGTVRDGTHGPPGPRFLAGYWRLLHPALRLTAGLASR